ncbi:hypothetical protein GIB67_014700 [Kingdonia uniflora]|uniref:Plastocyanin-like domain-containing protein n=1 Tax=Kingdonia uniflora TaxID=39325 RepID=A0A7J7NUV3_9MAGN|nr:hypothetical protein GIB67_014700 [Kingdonia uniflora]
MVVKPIPLDFDAMSTPRKKKPTSSSARNGDNLPVTPMVRTNAVIRSSVNGGGYMSKMVDFNKGERNVRNSCAVSFSSMSKFPRSKSEKRISTPPPRLRNTRLVAYNNLDQDMQSSLKKPQGMSVQPQLQSSNPMEKNIPLCPCHCQESLAYLESYNLLTWSKKTGTKLSKENHLIDLYVNKHIGTPWCDRTEGLTQCPITPGDTFMYQFMVDRGRGARRWAWSLAGRGARRENVNL